MSKSLLIISLFFFAAACGTPTDQGGSVPQNVGRGMATPATSSNAAAAVANTDPRNDAHEHTAPHGGTLIAFGDEFAHLEIVLDSSTGEITAYALDGEAEKSVPLAQSAIVIEVEKPKKFAVTLDAVENGLTGEKRGATSEFRGRSEDLRNLNDFDAHVRSITIRGKKFENVDFNFPNGNEGGSGHGHK